MVVEAKIMSLEKLRRWFLELKACLKLFGANFNVVFPWEKSMLSRGVFLVVCSPDCGHYISVNVDGAKSYE